MLARCRNFLVLTWGPIFVGAPVRPNMLNVPKSASGLGLGIGLGLGLGLGIAFGELKFGELKSNPTDSACLIS